jgi:hypothetical protein
MELLEQWHDLSRQLAAFHDGSAEEGVETRLNEIERTIIETEATSFADLVAKAQIAREHFRNWDCPDQELDWSAVAARAVVRAVLQLSDTGGHAQ